MHKKLLILTFCLGVLVTGCGKKEDPYALIGYDGSNTTLEADNDLDSIDFGDDGSGHVSSRAYITETKGYWVGDDCNVTMILLPKSEIEPNMLLNPISTECVLENISTEEFNNTFDTGYEFKKFDVSDDELECYIRLENKNGILIEDTCNMNSTKIELSDSTFIEYNLLDGKFYYNYTKDGLTDSFCFKRADKSTVMSYFKDSYVDEKKYYESWNTTDSDSDKKTGTVEKIELPPEKHMGTVVLEQPKPGLPEQQD